MVRFSKSLVWVCIYVLCMMPGGYKPKSPAAADIPQEFPITGIRIIGPLADPQQEISGLAWFKNSLIFLPQYASIHDLAPENRPVFYYLEKEDILAYLHNETSGKSPSPLKPSEIPLAIDPTLYEKMSGIDGFEGFEAIAFKNSQFFITIESSPPGQMLGYLVSGEIADDLSQLSLIDSGTRDLVQLQPQAAVSNACYESLLVLDQNVLVLYEGNGKNINPSPMAHVFDLNLRFIRSIAFPSIEYRITDATATDNHNRFWCINYFWPGRNENTKYNPAEDDVAKRFGKGKTHAEAVIVERLLEFQYVEGMGKMKPYISRTSSPPVQFVLAGPGIDHARNWEGLTRLDDIGFLVITDKHPGTILGFVKYNQ